MRKTFLACTVSLLMSPMAAWSLSIGDIQVNSSLNEPLQAEIELNSVTNSDLDTLRVGLPSRRVFARSNIEFSNYLTGFRFKLLQRNGQNLIAVSTRKPFKEPFANFLLEATWGSGHLIREYTMLIDPPEFVKQQARPVSRPSTSPSSQVKRVVKRPASSRQKTIPKSSQNYILTPSKTNFYSDLKYGPTKRNDTLWNIAKAMAPAGVSVNQMMMALLRDNPDAFIGNNINNLKSGYVLRIKDTATLSQLNKTAARLQVREQYQTWKELRKQKKSGANLVDRSDRSVEQKPVDGQLKLVATGESFKTDSEGNLSSQATEMKEQLTLASEEIESFEIANQELRARIKELEDILQTKTTLVQLKDESLAALQRQKEYKNQLDKLAEIQLLSDQVVALNDGSDLNKHIDPSVELAKDDALQEIDPSVELSKDVALQHIDPSVELAKEQSIKPESEVITPAPVVESKPKPEVTIKAKPETVPPQTKPEPQPDPVDEVIAFITDKEIMPYAAGTGVFLIALLAWLGLRGRSKNKNEFEESILDQNTAPMGNDFEDTKPIESGTEVLSSGVETSFLSDFTADDMETLQMDDTEADPLSEADVFMVYGRFQQAEELLKNALKKAPERVDFQMKLLEIYHGDNNKEFFAVQADVVKDLLVINNEDYESTPEWIKARGWAEKFGVDIDMPESFDEETALEDVYSTSSEPDQDDVSNELSLDSEEIQFNEASVLGDIDNDMSLSLDETPLTSGHSEDNLSRKDTDLNLELDNSAFDMVENNSGLDDKHFELDDINFELDDNKLENGNSPEHEKSPEHENSLDQENNSFELDDDNFELENTSSELENNVLDLDNTIKPDDTGSDLDVQSFNMDDDSLELEVDTLELDNDNLELDVDTLELDDSFNLEDGILEIGDESFDLNDDALELENSLEPTSSPELVDSPELDDSLQLGESIESEEISELDGFDLEEDLSNLDDVSPSTEVPEFELSSEFNQIDENFELDDDASLASEDELGLLGGEELDDENLDDFDNNFPELDAVGTKLDLAKAYIDMGDTESALSILKEVIDEGDDEQKSQANALLTQADA